MSVQLSPLAVQRFYDNNNNPLVGGQLFTYQAGTTTPQATYTDSTGSTSNPNPVIMNARGEAPVWLSPTQSYKLVLCDAAGNIIWTCDNVTSPAPVAVGNMTDEKGSGGTVGFAAGVDFTAGTTTSLTLSTNYYSASNLWVAFDGAEQGGDSFTLSGKTLTFNAPIPVGVNKVYVKGGSSLSVGTPGNGTIVDASVAAGTKLFNRITDIIDVKDFGALGNGTHDDTTSIQNAINFVSSLGGGDLYFPAGSYLTGALTMYPNIQIRGVGPATQFVPNAANVTVFSMTQVSATAVNSAFRNLQINAKALTGVIGISTVYCGSLTFVDLVFTGCATTIICDRGRLFFMERIVSQGTTLQANAAGMMRLYSSTDTEYITDIKVTKYFLLNIGNGTAANGIVIRRAVGAMLVECACNDMNVGNASPGIFITWENDCQGCKMSACIMGACEYMVLIHTGSGVNVAPSFIELNGCDCDQNYNTSLLIAQGNWITITGGMYTTSGVNTAGSGILVQGSATNVVINGVQFVGWNGTGGAGILLGACNQIKIQNCLFETNYQDIGIPSNNVTNCLITGNSFTSANPIGGTWTGQTNRAIGNIGFNPQPWVSVPAIPSTGTTIANTNAVDVDVYLSAGTITGINKNGISTGITGTGVVSLAPGDTIGLNYTGTPNWAWIGRK